jgi:hypothetical protein
MSSATVAATERHGKANLWVSINGLFYVARRIRRNHWAVTRTEKGRAITYHPQRLPEGGWSCTCPDHLNRFVRCKHVNALMACGLLPRIRPLRDAKGGE